MAAPTLLTFASVAARSVAAVVACAGTGAYARWTGVLTPENQKLLDKLVSKIFLPALILDTVVPNMNFECLLNAWPLAINCLCLVLYGIILGGVCGKAVPPTYKGLMMVAVAFPNSFSVPMTLLLTLGAKPFSDSTSEEQFSNYVSKLFLMSYVLWVLCRWSIGYPILSGAATCQEWKNKVTNPPVVTCVVGLVCGLAWDAVPAEPKAWSEDHVLPILTPLGTSLEYAGRCCVPCILLVLGATLYDAITDCSKATMVSAGTHEPFIQDVKNDDPLTEADMPRWAYVAVFVLRQIVGPLFAVFIACGLLRGVLGVHDHIVLMVAMLQGAGPPMINLAVMANLSGNAMKQVARLLLFTYVCSLFSWTAAIALFLRIL